MQWRQQVAVHQPGKECSRQVSLQTSCCPYLQVKKLVPQKSTQFWSLCITPQIKHPWFPTLHLHTRQSALAPMTCALRFDWQHVSFQFPQKHCLSSKCNPPMQGAQMQDLWERVPVPGIGTEPLGQGLLAHLVILYPGHPHCPGQDTLLNTALRKSQCVPTRHTEPTEWGFLIN